MPPNTRQHADDVLVHALAAGKRVAEAAEPAGVSTRAVFRRLQDYDFRERLAEVRTASRTSATGRLSDQLVRACEVLTDLVWVADPHLRLKAAKASIELTLKVLAFHEAQVTAKHGWGARWWSSASRTRTRRTTTRRTAGRDRTARPPGRCRSARASLPVASRPDFRRSDRPVHGRRSVRRVG